MAEPQVLAATLGTFWEGRIAVPLSSEKGTTQKDFKKVACKWLKLRPESGLDTVLCVPGSIDRGLP